MLISGTVVQGAKFQLEIAEYDPAADQWRRWDEQNFPTSHLAMAPLWTGSDLVLFGGGWQDDYYNDGAIYHLVP